jgi:hypothetical protein
VVHERLDAMMANDLKKVVFLQPDVNKWIAQ